jgi:uncharacterized repeat protein (TIGR03803 family)
VFQLSPAGNGGWTFSVLYSFDAGSHGAGGNLLVDNAGNLYGVTPTGGSVHGGSVFKLSRNGSSWTYTDLHDFRGGDGAGPSGNLVLAPNGDLYGTTSGGGAYSNGNVWQLSMQ